MSTKEFIRWSFAIIIVLGFLLAFLDFYFAAAEATEAGRNLDIGTFGEKLTGMFMAGTVLIISGVIVEILLSISDRFDRGRLY